MKKESRLLGCLDTKAFTLIELLVVVLIIGILAAVALPQYQVAVLKSRYVQAKTAATALAKAQQAYYLANGEYSHSFDELDIEIPGHESESDSAGYGVNRPHRYFKWGVCVLWQDGIVSCYAGKVGFSLFSTTTTHRYAGKTICEVKNTNLSSKENKLCKGETGLTTPTNVGDDYIEWAYP